MNKEGFLKKLREHLRVLDEKEQQDIIDEYAQHIDLKMKSGLSEEEAIRDFGNVEELAGEILEAYHVDPKFEEKTKGIVILTPDMEKVSKESRKLAGKVGGLFGKARDRIHRMKEGLAGTWKRFRTRLGSVRMASGEPDAGVSGRRELRKGGTLRRLLYNSGVLIWNLAWLFLSCVLIGIAALCLFGFGVMLILVFSGYPLLGAEIFCFGVAASGGALGLLTFSLRKRYRKKESVTDKTVYSEEVA